MSGRYFSLASTSATGTNAVDAWKTAVNAAYPSNTPFVIRKMTLISNAAQAIKVNGSTNFADLYEDPVDSKFKLSLDTDDVRITDVEFETGSVAYFVAFIY